MKTFLLDKDTQNRQDLVAVLDDNNEVIKYVVCHDYDGTKEYGNQWYQGEYFNVHPILGGIEGTLKDAEKYLHRRDDEEKKKKIRRKTVAQVIDAFENFLDEKGIRVPNEERDEEDPDNGANIYGEDFDLLMEEVIETLGEDGIEVPFEY